MLVFDSACYLPCFCLHTYLCDAQTQRARTNKASCWLAAQLFGQPMDSAHGLQLDKRVFILATAALLSAFAAPHPRCFLWQSWPKHCRPERAAVRGERRPAGSKKRDWWWSKWRDGETLTMRLALCVFESASLNSRWCGSASSLWSKLRYKKKKKPSLTTISGAAAELPHVRVVLFFF